MFFDDNVRGGANPVASSVASPSIGSGTRYTVQVRQGVTRVPGSSPKQAVSTVVPLRMLPSPVSMPAVHKGRRRRQRVKKRKGALRDSSCFECSALGKLMAPTMVVFAFIAGLWGDWVLTTTRLMIVSERTFFSEAFAVRSARALGRTYQALLAIPDGGSVPGADAATSEAVNRAVVQLSDLVGGVQVGALTSNAVPALEESDYAFDIILENACTVTSEVYAIEACGDFESGLLATAGLRGGLLRFASAASSFASQLATGDIRGGNTTAMQAALDSRDEVAFIQAMAPRGSIAFNTTRLLHRLVFPYMLGVSNHIASDFQQNGRDIHGAALVRSQALTGVMMAIMVLSTAVWVWPGARRLGRDVYATHALLAAVPPDVQGRVMALHTILHRIATMASKDSGADNSLSDMGALMDMDELVGGGADGEVDADRSGHQPETAGGRKEGTVGSGAARGKAGARE